VLIGYAVSFMPVFRVGRSVTACGLEYVCLMHVCEQ
jgi:hypothetical protein